MQVNFKFTNKKYKDYYKNGYPDYAKSGDACVDLYAVSMNIVYREDHHYYESNILGDEGEPPKQHGPIKYIEYGLGIQTEIPDGYIGLAFPRSSISDYDLVLANSVGVIDAGYRGEWKARFKPFTGDPYVTPSKFYKVGDRVCQLMIIPRLSMYFLEVGKLSESERGNGGFGSSGK